MRKRLNLQAAVFDADGMLWPQNTIQLLGKAVGVEREYAELEQILHSQPGDATQVFVQGMSILKGLSKQAYTSTAQKIAAVMDVTQSIDGLLRGVQQCGLRTGILSGTLLELLTAIVPLETVDFCGCNVLALDGLGVTTGIANGYLRCRNEVTAHALITTPESKRDCLTEACRQMQIDPRETIGFGHDYIDSLFLEEVGLPVTVESADARIVRSVQRREGIVLSDNNHAEMLRCIRHLTRLPED